MPGYVVERALPGGRQRAVEPATGARVLLQPCAAPVEALAAGVRTLRDLPSPYVLRPRSVVDSPAGPVLVLDDAPAGTLSELLERRGRLPAGEVVTVGVTVGRALAALHAAGVVHGALSADDVVFAATGMPLLAGVRVGHGTAGGAAAGGAAADDVLALAALCATALLGDGVARAAPDPVDAVPGEAEAVRALLAVVEAGLALEPARRPSAAALATAFQRAVRAAPVRGLRVAGPALLEPGPPPLLTAPAPRPAPPRAEPGSPPALHRGGAAGSPAESGREHRRPGRHAAPIASAGTPWTRARRIWLVTGCAAATCAATAAVLLLLRGSTSPAPGASPLGPPAIEPLVLARPRGGNGSAAVPPAPHRPAGSAGAAVTRAAPPGGRVSTDWAAELDRLDRTRAAAYATGDRTLLRRVYVRGTAAEQADLAVLDQLSATGRTVTGLRHRLVQVTPHRTDAERAELRVVDVLREHTVRDSSGTRLETRPGRNSARSVVVLRRVQGEWRLERVRPG